MSKQNCLLTKERRLHPVLYLLPQTKHLGSPRLALALQYGQMQRFTGWCLHFLNHRWQLGLLASRNSSTRPRENYLRKSPWPIPILTDVVWSKKHPQTFQTAIEVILLSVKWQSALVYSDDIVAFLKSFHDHLLHRWRVLTLLQNADVTLDLKSSLYS